MPALSVDENLVERTMDESDRASLDAILGEKGPIGLQRHAFLTGFEHSVHQLTPFRFFLSGETDTYRFWARNIDQYPHQTFPDSKVRSSLAELRKFGETLGKAAVGFMYGGAAALAAGAFYAIK